MLEGVLLRTRPVHATWKHAVSVLCWALGAPNALLYRISQVLPRAIHEWKRVNKNSFWQTTFGFISNYYTR